MKSKKITVWSIVVITLDSKRVVEDACKSFTNLSEAIAYGASCTNSFNGDVYISTMFKTELEVDL